MTPPKLTTPQCGAALLTAMLIMTIVTMLISGMLWDANLTIRRAQNILFSDQALQYALGAETWAQDILRTDLEQQGAAAIDHRNEAWATALPPLPIEGGAIEGILEDMQGRFNLNNLIGQDGAPDEAALQQFRRLLNALGLDPALADATADWVDPNGEPAFPDGAEDDFYTARQPPYRPANLPMASPTELLAVGQMNVQGWRLLRPYVAALPAGTAINVNTALPPVLQSLSDTLGPSDAAALYEQAGAAPFEDLTQLADLLGQQTTPVDVSSRFFRLEVRVTLGPTLFVMYSLLERDQTGGVFTRYRTFYTE